MTKLGEHVAPALDEARHDRQWKAVRAGTIRAARLRPMLAGAGVLAAAAAAVLIFTLGRTSAELPTVTLAEGSVIETSEGASEARLVDGSEVALSPGTRLEVAEADEESDVEVVLARGAATFEVTRNPRRTFTVRAGDVRVVVVGTHFTVRNDADGTARVDVERGIVEVHHGSETTRLVAGQSWSGGATPSTPEVETETGTETSADEELPSEVSPIATEEAPPAPAHAPREATSDARALFEAARTARRDGDPAEAERLYATLLREHPRDPRAGVVAFELGRLRMDVLGDDEGAIESLGRAIRGRAAASYREDAMARLAVAQGHLGHASACARARDAYLAEFPAGVHTAVVSDACH
ncbi:MAG: FecR domain-containing protein [Sandaracinus sp.]